MHVIALHGIHGGTGRTTLIRLLASALAAQGRRVLVLDATGAGHIPDWGSWFDAQRHDRLSRRIHLARAPQGPEVERTVHLARGAGVELCLVDTPGLPAHLDDPRTHAALRQADLALLPLRGPNEAAPALAELRELEGLRVAALAAGPFGDPGDPARATLRTAWEGAGGLPEALMRAGLGHHPVLAIRGELPAWAHVVHADLLAREGGQRTSLFGAHGDVTGLLARQPFDPVRLAALGALVRDANLLAAETLLRLQGLCPVPLEPLEDAPARTLVGVSPAA